jgi:excisionase family DNA binding protein
MNAITNNAVRSIMPDADSCALGERIEAANHNEPLPRESDAVLDVEQVAALLRIGRNSVYEAVGRNEMPHRRIGKQIRFSRAAILRWLGE